MIPLLKGERTGERAVNWRKICQALPNGLNPAVLLFTIGCIIFTLDGASYIFEDGVAWHSSLYTAGSVIFFIGCLLFLDFDAGSTPPQPMPQPEPPQPQPPPKRLALEHDAYSDPQPDGLRQLLTTVLQFCGWADETRRAAGVPRVNSVSIALV